MYKRSIPRKSLGTCPWCKKPVKSGVKFWESWWHRSCLRKRNGHDRYGKKVDVKIPRTYKGDRG